MAPSAEAEIVAGVSTATVAEPTENVTEVPPPGIVTVPGTLATTELADRVTTNPESGAGEESDKVPCAVFPPGTVPGATITVCSFGAVTVSSAVLLAPAVEALIAAGVSLATAIVVSAKVAWLSPSGTVTVPGVVTARVLLCNCTETPPAPAAPERVNVPVTLLLPGTLEESSAKDCKVAAFTVSTWLTLTPL